MRAPNPRFVPVALAFLLGVLASKGLPDQHAGPEGSDEEQEEADREEQRATGRSFEVAQEHRETQGEKHREKEEAYWRRSIWLSLGSLAGAVLGIGIATLAFHEARRQADAAIATSRPWLTYDLSAVGGLSWRNGEGRLLLETTVRNLGHSPAHDVKRAIFPVVGEAGFARAGRICERVKEKDFGDIGYLLFLDDGGKLNALESRYEAVFKLPPPRRGDGASIEGSRDLYVVACVLYGFGDGTTHETRRIVRIMQSASGSGNAPSPVDVLRDVAGPDLVLRDRVAGSRAD